MSRPIWHRSSFCNGAATCVEVAMLDGLVVVRDAKDPYRAVLIFSEREWTAFIAGVREGQFDTDALASDGAARPQKAATAGVGVKNE